MRHPSRLLFIFSFQVLLLQACGQEQKSETKGKGEVQTVASVGNRNPDGTVTAERMIWYQTAADGSFYSDRIEAVAQSDGSPLASYETTVWSDGQNEFPVCEEGMTATYKDEKGHTWYKDPKSQGVCKVIEP